MKREHKWLIIAAILLPIVVGLVIAAAGSMGAGGLSPFGGGRRVGVIRIEGVILSSEKFVEQLREYERSPSIAVVVLRVNSGGGAVAPSQEMHRAVLQFCRSGKSVIASIENVGASGAYYVVSACDRIFANPGAITGSIGVAIRLSRMHRLLGKLGVEFEAITAGELKDAGSPYREMTAEERQYLQEVVDDIHAQFIEDVGAARSVELDSLRALAEGQIFTGRQALRNGLVDTVGGYEDALSYAREVAGLPDDARVYEKRSRRPLWRHLLSGKLEGIAGAVDRVLYPGGIYYLYGTD